MNPFPARLDCSGFVCYAIGIPRQLPPGSGHWISTDEIWAHGSPALTGLFPNSPGVEVGDLLVYPDYVTDRRHDGHVGIVTAVANGQATKVIHCSSGNYRRTGDAVQETGPERMALRANYRTVRPDYDLLRQTFGTAPASPRLILAKPSATSADHQSYANIASAKLVNNAFEVDPKEVAAFLDKTWTGAPKASIRSVLTTLAVPFIVNASHVSDTDDPRVYVFTEA